MLTEKNTLNSQNCGSFVAHRSLQHLTLRFGASFHMRFDLVGDKRYNHTTLAYLRASEVDSSPLRGLLRRFIGYLAFTITIRPRGICISHSFGPWE